MKTGLGIRPELFDSVLAQKPDVGFLEAHSENYFSDVRARALLLELRHDYPVSLHGVGLSLGRADNLNQAHLQSLKLLVDEIDPLFVSEHLAWSAYSHIHVPDLLPVPLTEEALGVMCEHVIQMQDALQRQVFVENPSNYLLFDELQIPEPEFLNEIAQRTGCGLLIDVNNIYVSAQNLNRDALQYISGLDSGTIGQYHLAGYTPVERNGEQVLIDTHNQRVHEPVWDLFQEVVKLHGPKHTLVEWDSDFPALPVLLSECQLADQVLKNSEELPFENVINSLYAPGNSLPEPSMSHRQQLFLQQLLDLDAELSAANKGYSTRLWVYQNNVFGALQDYMTELYPAVRGVVGADFFKQMVQVFIQASPPSQGNIHVFGGGFDSILAEFPSLRELPYLADLINYEWALHKAYFGSLNNALDPTGYSQEELLSVGIEFNDCVSLIDSIYPLEEIHRQSLPDFDGQVSIDLGQSQDSFLVYKRENDVMLRMLDDDELTFFRKIVESQNLMQVIEGVGGSITPASLSSLLATVFEQKLLRTPKGGLH